MHGTVGEFYGSREDWKSYAERLAQYMTSLKSLYSRLHIMAIATSHDFIYHSCLLGVARTFTHTPSDIIHSLKFRPLQVDSLFPIALEI